MKKKVIFFVFLIAFLIRLISLNQSLWLDEATTARVVQQYDFSEIITKYSVNDFHPPLYYLFMKFWTNIFGYSEIALRMPSVLFSLTTGWIVYLIGGVWAVMLFLFNPLIVYYSQEARMYMMATMFLTGALYYFLRLVNFGPDSRLRGNDNKFDKDIFLFSLFCVLAFFTFYGSVFLIAAFLIYLLYKKRYRNFILVSAFLTFAFLVVSPLLYQQVINAKISLANVANWSLVLGKANLKNLILIPVKFSIGRIDFYPKWLYYLITGLWTFFVFSVLFKNLILDIKNSIKVKNFKLKIFLTFLFIFPLFLGFFISFFTPLLQYFRFLYLIPIMAILFTAGKHKKLTKIILTGGFLVFSIIYLLLPQFHREDWKNLTKSLSSGKPVYMIASSSDPIKYYNKKIQIKDLADLKEMSTEAVDMVVIPYTADIHGIDYKKILKEKKYKLSRKKTLRGLELEYWSKPNLTEAVGNGFR